MTRWFVVRVGGAALCGTALIGLLHLPAARPLLAWLGACPVRATPIATERARARALVRLRGTVAAPTRPALGFTLDTRRSPTCGRGGTATGSPAPRPCRTRC